MRIIQVGLGNWGRDWHEHVLRKRDGVEIAGLVDADADTLRRAAGRFQVDEHSCFESLDHALASVECDAVLVTATLRAHAPACRAALVMGRHVLCEKPFTETVEEAVELAELAASRDRVLMVSQNYRHFPAMRWLARAARDRRYGDLSSVSIDFRQYANGPSNTNHRYLESRHPLLMDMAIHHMDLLRLVVASEPVDVSCTVQNPTWSRFRDPPTAFATITFPGDVIASYRGSWISHGRATPWAGVWRVEFEHANVVVHSRGKDDGSEDSAVVYLNGSERGTPVTFEPDGAPVDRMGTLSAFIAAVVTGQEPETSAHDNTSTLRLMHRLISSAEEHFVPTRS
jgi:predicted dehydrogenase